MSHTSHAYPFFQAAALGTLSLLAPAFGTQLHAAPLSFQPSSVHATGKGPVAVASGDFNRDGKRDLVTANRGGNSVSVLLATGTKSFRPKVDYATGRQPKAVAIADLNHDGKLDLVTANVGGNSVSVLLGNGNGTFKARVNYVTGKGPVAVAIADVNLDAKPDLVTANGGSASLSILSGRGDGSFKPKIDRATDMNPNTVAVTDANRDRKPDLVSVSPEAGTEEECFSSVCGSLNVFPGNGNGTFKPRVRSVIFAGQSGFASQVVEALSVADMNRDGKSDLVIMNTGFIEGPTAETGVKLGDGHGGFGGEFADATFDGFAGFPKSLALADMNRDGKLDLIIAGAPWPDSPAEGPGGVAVVLGNGGQTFQPDFSAPGNLAAVVVVDVNRDTKPDLVTVDANKPRVNVLLNTTP